MKKFLLPIFLSLCLIFTQVSFAFESMSCISQNNDELSVEALSAIVMEAKSGRVIYAKNINQKLPMASTTKILTTMIALEQIDKNEKFEIDEKLIAAEGSSMGLRSGDIVDLNDLAVGMMLPSGNDAANATAIKIAGSKENFAELMNKKAEEIGMFDSHFVTPSGLDDDAHYSTAYDMAILTAYALKNQQFREICAKSKETIMLGNPPTERTLFNYNKLLSMYEYCIGVKTGYTDNARRCLVSAASKNGIELITITMNCHDDFNTHIKLYDYYFNKLKLHDLSYLTQNLKVSLAGTGRNIKAVPVNMPLVPLFDEDLIGLNEKTTIKKIIYPPVNINDNLGEICVYANDTLVYKSPLVSANKVEVQQKTKEKFSFFKKIFKNNIN